MALAKSQQSLKNWGKQKWRTSDRKPSKGKKRYLPDAAWKALSPSEKAATNKAKAKGNKAGKQFVKQPKKIAKKTAGFRQEKQVALGEYGTTLLDELNRLANGGTYRTPGDMVDQAKAARQWAVQRGVTPQLTDTVGVLNEIDGRTDRNNFLDFSGICNVLASTTGLPAAQALRAISS